MKRVILFVLIAAAILAACAPAAQTAVDSRDLGYVAPQSGYGGGAPAEEYKAVDSNVANVPGSVEVAQSDRLVIQNADLAIVVTDPKVKMDAVVAMAERMGGYVVSMNLNQTYAPDGTKVPEVYMTIRVPAEQLQDALKAIKEGAGEVQYENISGQDVTSQYTDLKSRLKNYEAAEQQLQDILDRAEKIEDINTIFNQLVYYREQIELVKGQMKYYEESAALSAITLRIIAEKTVQPIEIGGWQPQGTVRDALQDLLYFFQNFVDFLIWFVLNFLIKLLAVVLVFGTPIWLIVRGIRKALKKNKANQTPPPPAQQ
jgi:hypothetical protein